VRAVRLGAEVLAVAIGVEVALRRRGFDDVLKATSEMPRRYLQPPNIHPVTLERAIRMVYRLLPVQSTCLKQSLVFCRMRRRWGLPAELRLGVQKSDGIFAAHSWVEDGNGNVLTDPLEGFNPVQLPRSARQDARATD
jgi:transglutaminase superfamily protein